MTLPRIYREVWSPRYRIRRRWNIVRLAFEAIGASVFMALVWLGLVVLVAVGFSR